MEALRPDPPLPIGIKLTYGVGQIAEGAKNGAFELFLFFYYNQVLGLSGTLAGAAMLIALVVDAITDPAVGSLSDSLHSRWGRRHPFLYASALPLAVSFALLFDPPGGLSQAGLFAWLTGFSLATRFAMTLYFVPHLALGAELSADYRERTSVVAYRTLFSIVGAAGISLIGLGWFFRGSAEQPNGQLLAAAYPGFGTSFAVVMALAILLCAAGTHHRIPALSRPAHDIAPFSPGRVLEELRAALRNRSFRALFLGLVVFFVMRGVQTSLGLHMGTYFWRITTQQIFELTLGSVVGILIGLPFWAVASRRLDKRPAFLIGVIGFSSFVLLPPTLELLGLYPPHGSPGFVAGLVGASAIASFFAAAAVVTAGSMLADLADEHELASGRRQEGILFGAQSFAAKSAAGVGHQIAGLGLDWVGFPAQAVPGSVAAEHVTALGILAGPGIGVLAVLATVFLAGYRLDRSRHAEIALALAERRAGSG